MTVLILGSRGSGKFTLMKSIIAHQGLYQNDIRMSYKLTIFKNIHDCMRRVLEAREIVQIKDAKIHLNAKEFEDSSRIFFTIKPDKIVIVLSAKIASVIKALWKEPSVHRFIETFNEFYTMDSAE